MSPAFYFIFLRCHLAPSTFNATARELNGLKICTQAHMRREAMIRKKKTFILQPAPSGCKKGIYMLNLSSIRTHEDLEKKILIEARGSIYRYEFNINM